MTSKYIVIISCLKSGLSLCNMWACDVKAQKKKKLRKAVRNFLPNLINYYLTINLHTPCS